MSSTVQTKPVTPSVSRLFEPMLKTQQAAEMLGVTSHFLYKDRMRGANALVPFVRVGGAVRYRLSDLHAFIAKNTNTAE